MTNEYINSLYDKYGVEPENICERAKCNMIPKDEDCPYTGINGKYCDNCILPPLTSDKVLALEEVVFDMQQEDFYPYKPSKDKWCYQWKREYFVKDTRIEALCSLLIYLHQYFNEQEREQIREVLRG